MTILRTRSFEKDFKKLPSIVQEGFVKQLGFFLTDPFHNSLQTKKMHGTASIWEVRITRGYRFTFIREANIVYLRRIGTHDILRNP